MFNTHYSEFCSSFFHFIFPLFKTNFANSCSFARAFFSLGLLSYFPSNILPKLKINIALLHFDLYISAYSFAKNLESEEQIASLLGIILGFSELMINCRFG